MVTAAGGGRRATDSAARRPRLAAAVRLDRGARRRLLASLELFVFDVDGVLTDGAIYLGPGNLELKRFAVEDGTAFVLLRALGKDVAWISGRRSEVVVKRARELGVRTVIQGVADKEARLEDLCRRRGIAMQHVFFQGDDLIDLAAMRRVGCPVAPANAPEDVRRAALYVTPRPGGHGAARDAVEWALRGAGVYEAAREAYLGSKRREGGGHKGGTPTPAGAGRGPRPPPGADRRG